MSVNSSGSLFEHVFNVSIAHESRLYNTRKVQAQAIFLINIVGQHLVQYVYLLCVSSFDCKMKAIVVYRTSQSELYP
jgi:hypothetical protein